MEGGTRSLEEGDRIGWRNGHQGRNEGMEVKEKVD